MAKLSRRLCLPARGWLWPSATIMDKQCLLFVVFFKVDQLAFVLPP